MNLPATLQFALAVAAEPPPIVGGVPTSEWPGVGALVASDGAQAAAFCSGSLIDPEFVLTAGHCLDAADMYAEAGLEIYFLWGTDATSEDGIDGYEQAAAWESHPNYNPRTLQADIGIIQLSNPVSNVEPIELDTTEPEESWTEDSFDLVGWGVTEQGGQDAGVKRTLSLRWREADDNFHVLYTSGGGNLCSGDSGGATLRVQADGSTALVGVNSFVFSVQDTETWCEGGGAGATRVDAHQDFIMDTVEQGTGRVDQTGNTDDGVSTGSLVEDEKSGCHAASGPVSAWSTLLLLLALPFRSRRTTQANP